MKPELILLRDLEARGGTAKVLFITAGVRQNLALDILARGVSGIILKHSGPNLLLDAIRRVNCGEIFLDRKLIAGADRSVQPASSKSMR